MKAYNKTLLAHLEREHAKELKRFRKLKLWRSQNRHPRATMKASELKKLDQLDECKANIRKLSVQILKLKQPYLFD